LALRWRRAAPTTTDRALTKPISLPRRVDFTGLPNQLCSQSSRKTELPGVFSDLYAEGADLLQGVTGWDVTGDELRQTATRIVTAKKLFNQREGWTAAEDTLPNRMLSERLPAGPAPGAELPAERLREMVAAYYQGRGWSPDGRVSSASIDSLGLGDLAANQHSTT
jgi:aldehyde:ferredoxin oxidoreductase